MPVRSTRLADVFSDLIGILIKSTALLGVGKVLLLLFYTLLARRLGPSEYGVISLAITLALTLSMVSSFGLYSTGIRFVPQYRTLDQTSELRGFLHFSLFCLPAGIALCVGVSLVGWTGNADFSNAIALSVCISVPATLSMIRVGIARGMGYVVLAFGPREILYPLIAMLIILIFGGDTATSGALTIAAVWTSVEVLGLVFCAPRIFKMISGSEPVFLTREWVKVSIPVIISSTFYFILNRMDLVVVSIFCSMREVGLYSAAFTLSMMIRFVSFAVNMTFGPRFSEAFHSGRESAVGGVLRQAMGFSALAGTCVFLAVFVLADWLLGFFGPEYVDASTVLRFLALGHLVATITGPVSDSLVMTEHERISSFLVVVSSIVVVILLFVAVPIWGYVAAAVCTVFGTIILSVSMTIIAVKKFILVTEGN